MDFTSRLFKLSRNAITNRSIYIVRPKMQQSRRMLVYGEPRANPFDDAVNGEDNVSTALSRNVDGQSFEFLEEHRDSPFRWIQNDQHAPA